MQVRGISLISIRDYVKSRLSYEQFDRFMSRLPRDEANTVTAARKSEWYPFGIQRHLREEIVSQFDPANPRQAIMDMARFTSGHQVSSFLRGLIGMLPVETVLRQAAGVWGKFYRPGQMKAVNVEERKVIFELRDFACDPLFCPGIEVWIASAAESMGLADVTVKETACIHNGDGLCRWEVRWK